MFPITIDGVEYDTGEFSEEARKQLASIQFVDAEIQRMNAQLAVWNTARAAYSAALKAALPAPTGKPAKGKK